VPHVVESDCPGICQGLYSAQRLTALATTTPTRSVRIFRNGRSQAIRIPAEFALPGNEATISRDRKGRLIVEAARKPSLTELLDSWEPLEDKDAMPEIEDFPPEPFDL
jgi:antitoxin VapB